MKIEEIKTYIDLSLDGFNKLVAEVQLETAIDLYDKLHQPDGVAYLADEVGMGKTFVSIALMTLCWQFSPRYQRILVIAPKQTVQRGWIRKYNQVVKQKVTEKAYRVKDILTNSPTHTAQSCNTISDLIESMYQDKSNVTVTRMSIFSHLIKQFKILGSEKDITIDNLLTIMNNTVDEKITLSLQSKVIDFKIELQKTDIPSIQSTQNDLQLIRTIAVRTMEKLNEDYQLHKCQPFYDLIVIDEGHELRTREQGSQKVEVLPRLLNLLPPGTSLPQQVFYPEKRPGVLFLSATPSISHSDDILKQFEFVLPKSTIMTTSTDNSNQAIYQKYFLRHLRQFSSTFSRHTKYDYRYYQYQQSDLTIFESLFFGLLEKRFVEEVNRLIIELEQENDYQNKKNLERKIRKLRNFTIGSLDYFESIVPVNPSEDKDKLLNLNTNTSENIAPDTEILRQLVNCIQDSIASKTSNETSHFLFPHPKQRTIEECTRIHFTSDSFKKSLIFVNRIPTVKELESKIISVYDNEIIPFYCQQFFPAETMNNNIYDWLKWLDKQEEKRKGNPQSKVTETSKSEEYLSNNQEQEILETETKSQFLKAFIPQAPKSNESKTQKKYIHLSEFRNKVNSNFTLIFEENLCRLWFEVCMLLDKDFATFFKNIDNSYEHWLNINMDVTIHISKNRDTIPLREKAQSLHRALLWEIQNKKTNITPYPTLFTQYIALVLYQMSTTLHTSREVKNKTPKKLSDFKTYLDYKSIWDFIRATETVHTPMKRLRDEIFSLDMFEITQKHKIEQSLKEREYFKQLLSKILRLGEGQLWLLVGALKPKYIRDSYTQTTEFSRRLYYLLSPANNASPTILCRRIMSRINWYITIKSELNLMIPDNSYPNFSKFSHQNPCEGVSGSYGSDHSTRNNIITRFNSPFFPDFIVCTNIFQEGVDLHLSCTEIWHYGFSKASGITEQRIGRLDRFDSMSDKLIQQSNTKDQVKETLHVNFPCIKNTRDEKQLALVLSNFHTSQPALDSLTVVNERSDIYESDLDLENVYNWFTEIQQKMASHFQTRQEEINVAQSKVALGPYPARKGLILNNICDQVPQISGISVKFDQFIRKIIADSQGIDVIPLEGYPSNNIYWFNLPQELEHDKRDQPIQVHIKHHRESSYIVEIASFIGYNKPNDLKNNRHNISNYLKSTPQYQLRDDNKKKLQWEIYFQVEVTIKVIFDDVQTTKEYITIVDCKNLPQKIEDFARTVDILEKKLRNDDYKYASLKDDI